MAEGAREIVWIASSLRDIKTMPVEVQSGFGFALYLAQLGQKHVAAKPLKGYGGGSVLEVVEDFDGDTYRAVYTVKFSSAVYVLDVFQKKSKSGIKIAQHDLKRVESRYKLAKKLHEESQ